MWSLANPTVFLALVRRTLPWLALATAVLFAVGLWMAMAAPPDYQQGETVKIMYCTCRRPGSRPSSMA